jgi:membrane protein implicated in regulation of membrane protease activity
MRQDHGFHYTPCSTASAGVLRLLVLAGAVAAVVFWPTVVAIATTVALILKLALIGLAAVAVLGAATTVVIAVRRRRSTSTPPVVAIQPERDRRIEEQLAALTAAVKRLELDQQPALPTPAAPVVLDPQTLTLLVAQLTQMADSAGRRPRALTDRRNTR